MDRRDFMKGAAVTIAAISAGGGALNVAEAEPAITEAPARLMSITLPASYVGRSFTITNTGDIPIIVTGGPTDIVVPPGGELVAPEHIVKFR